MAKRGTYQPAGLQAGEAQKEQRTKARDYVESLTDEEQQAAFDRLLESTPASFRNWYLVRGINDPSVASAIYAEHLKSEELPDGD